MTVVHREYANYPTCLFRRRKSASIMRSLMLCVAIVIVNACVGCADAPKSSQVTLDPVLERKGGVLLLVDASIHEETLAGENYFVINEAQAGAEAAAAAMRNYVQVADSPIRAEFITIGGARLTAQDASISVADNVGGPLRQAPSSISCQTKQPLKVPENIRNDPQYVSALRTVSSHALELSGTHPTHANSTTTISADDFQKAAEVIHNRTQASSVLFLGVLGWSRSSGKRATQFVVGMAIGEAVAVATAGLGTGYYLVFIPGHSTDGMVMEGALVDLQSGQLIWSNAVRSVSDPVDPTAMADPHTLDLLFHGLVFEPVSTTK